MEPLADTLSAPPACASCAKTKRAAALFAARESENMEGFSCRPRIAYLFQR